MRIRLSAILLCTLLLSTVSETAFAAFDGSALAQATDSGSAAMDYVAGRGLLDAENDGLLHPEHLLSRIDLIRAIVRDVYVGENRGACFTNIASRQPADYTLLFTDVRRTDAVATDVCIGMFVGIVSGRPDGSLRPLAGANLAESAKVISKAYGIAPFLGLRPDTRVPWHEPYWYALARRGAIPESVKLRSQVLTRGEFAEILYRLRSERPTVGFRDVTMFARDDGTSSSDSAAVMIPGSSAPQSITPWERDRLALSSRARHLVVASPPAPKLVSQADDLGDSELPMTGVQSAQPGP